MTLEAAGIAITTGEKVLLLQRQDGSWGVPGGKVEPGEDLKCAALRETLEETGLALTNVLTPLGCVTNSDGFTFTCFAAKVGDEYVPTLSDEHTGWLWASLDRPPYPMFMSTADFLAALNPAAMDKADGSARLIDNNGWFEVKRNPISKAGVFPYLGKSIPGADPDQIYPVYRPAEELSNPETIESIKLIPWIDNHVMLGNKPNTTPAEEKGIHGVIGQDVFFEGDTLYGNLKLFSNEQSAVIASGKKELSLGFRCKYEHAPGVFNGQPYEYVQRVIRGNHIASVMDGRMGPEVAVLDHFSFTFDSKDIQTMATENENPEGGAKGATIEDAIALFKQLQPLLPALIALANGGGAATPAAGAEDGDKKTTPADMTAAVEDAKEKGAAAGKAAGEEAGKAAGEEAGKAAVASAMDAMPAAIIAAFSARDRLASRLSAHVGAFDHSDKTHAEVVAYGIEKLGIKDAPKGNEGIYLDAYLAALPAPSKARMSRSADVVDHDDTTGEDELPKFLADTINKE